MNARLAFWLFAAALLGWWFFAGDDPVQLIRQFVGRGKKLSTSTLRADGSLAESVEDIVEQVENALARSVGEDAVLMARVSASEHAGANEKEKAAIQWVLKNDAEKHGWSIQHTVTVNPGTLGSQAGRRYSTAGGGLAGSREIHEDDIYVAESIRAGVIPDLTYGATKFVHMTGYAKFEDFLLGHPKVQAWLDGGLAPVFLGGVSTLVVFLPKDQVANGQPIAATEGEA
jgi:hypothetical protein